jgi:hypothetical protein
MTRCPVRIDQVNNDYIVYVMKLEGYEANVFDKFSTMIDYLFDYFGKKKVKA